MNWLRRLMCAHDWRLYSTQTMPGAGSTGSAFLETYMCVRCGEKKWRMN
jgi:hypothetical protein